MLKSQSLLASFTSTHPCSKNCDVFCAWTCCKILPSGPLRGHHLQYLQALAASLCQVVRELWGFVVAFWRCGLCSRNLDLCLWRCWSNAFCDLLPLILLLAAWMKGCSTWNNSNNLVTVRYININVDYGCLCTFLLYLYYSHLILLLT